MDRILATHALRDVRRRTYALRDGRRQASDPLVDWASPVLVRRLSPVVDALIAAGVFANAVTGASLVAGLFDGAAFALGHFGIAGFAIAVASLGDAVDGLCGPPDAHGVVGGRSSTQRWTVTRSSSCWEGSRCTFGRTRAPSRSASSRLHAVVLCLLVLGVRTPKAAQRILGPEVQRQNYLLAGPSAYVPLLVISRA
jgi:hypothetical protein